MEYRKAIAGDEQQLIDLFSALAAETDFMLFEPGERELSLNEQAELIDSISHSSNRLLLVAVAAEKDKIVGFLGATGGSSNRSSYTANFVLGVLKAHWGKNIGKSLLSDFEEWATYQEFKRLEMTVIESNSRAISLYVSNGYEVEGIRRSSMNVNGVFVNEVYMSKLLS